MMPAAQLNPDRLSALRQWTVVATPGPQLLLKVLGLFALQDVLPVSLHAEADDNQLTIILDEQRLDHHRSLLIAEKIRSMIGVVRVDLVDHPACAMADEMA